MFSGIEATENSNWSPTLLSVNPTGRSEDLILFMVFGSIDVSRKSACWTCIQICEIGDVKSRKYTFEFSLLNMNTMMPYYICSIPVSIIGEKASKTRATGIPGEIPFHHIMQHCVDTREVLISLSVQPCNPRERQPPEVELVEEVWSFRMIPTTLGSSSLVVGEGFVCPDITCNGCGKQPILGNQHKCLQCPNYELCGKCVANGIHSAHMFITVSTFGQRQLLRKSFIPIW
ncbi:Protein ref(2)P [Orchesella cincta]|uniref:Protein ref(2)P n=1 Tax=Orchesella cincta TaxID=48709 RepID=A0A1D2MIN1_ORCCI|nr:Protein ref(2)P [Orchesella cincta]